MAPAAVAFVAAAAAPREAGTRCRLAAQRADVRRTVPAGMTFKNTLQVAEAKASIFCNEIASCLRHEQMRKRAFQARNTIGKGLVYLYG